jgi:prevent-host-death family protein
MRLVDSKWQVIMKKSEAGGGKTVGAYDAKTHLPQLLDRVVSGEEFTITRHGKPVARLVAVGGKSVEERRAVITRIKNLGARLSSPAESDGAEPN